MTSTMRLTALVAVAGLLLFSLPATANNSAASSAAAEAESSAERQARGEIESLLGRLCPGRCELIDIDVTVGEPSAIGSVSPGFEGAGPSSFEAEVQRIEATVMMDSGLPENFQASIPRMAEFRLQELADDIIVSLEPLEFPNPQLPPMPDGIEQTPPQPEPLPEPMPFEEPEPEPEPEPEDDEEATDEEPAETGPPLWQQVLPWIALLLTLLILGGLIILILRRLESMADSDRAVPESDETAEPADITTMPDTDALRDDLTRSRSVLNRMLRQWIEDDPKEVAHLVRLVGPDLLSDLRRDPDLRPSLEVVSDHVAGFDKRIDPDTAQSITEKARSRYDAQLVVDDGRADAEWDFLEGLTLGQVSRLLDSTSRREKSFVLTRLSPIIRSRFLEGLDPDRRRRLLLEASSSESLSKTESRELAGRLRQIADEFTDAAREAEGQAAMLIEMLEAMELDEQRDVLRDMSDNRPDVADAVLSRLCLESALLEVPDEIVADTVHRMPVEPLTTFLQATRDDITQRILEASPTSKRQAVSTELSLDIPATRADFLEARRQFSDTVVSTLRRNGYDILEFNTNALQARSPESNPTEVAR